MEKLYIGIDIGGTSAKFGLVTEKGEILLRDSVSVDFDGYETPILKTVTAHAKSFLQSEDVQRCLSAFSDASTSGLSVRMAITQANADINGHTEKASQHTARMTQKIFLPAGIGVSATGQIDERSGAVIGAAGHIPHYIGSRIKETLEREIGVRTMVANDANCALLGECWIGAAVGRTDVIMMTIGTGVGGGILSGGSLISGKRGIGGEIGHIIINEDGERCTCGNQGCLEHYASTNALIRMVEQEIEAGNIDRGFFPTGVDGKRIFEKLSMQEDVLNRVVARWQSYIADGLVSLIHIFEPEMVVIGGGVSAAGELFLEPIRKDLLHRVMPAFSQGLQIVPAALANDAGMIGAIYYFRKQEYENL
ncbi:MAG: ROK family protein [Oribacterium sp.]|nr:ROK family protein [Oribacterium sp.]MDY6316327.1 ROK family protein [Oribacterium sp.]